MITPKQNLNAVIRWTIPTQRVLMCLHEHPEGTFGYIIGKEKKLAYGSVYPILHRLESHGWIEGWWSDFHHDTKPIRYSRRRYYVLTDLGKQRMEEKGLI